MSDSFQAAERCDPLHPRLPREGPLINPKLIKEMYVDR